MSPNSLPHCCSPHRANSRLGLRRRTFPREPDARLALVARRRLPARARRDIRRSACSRRWRSLAGSRGNRRRPGADGQRLAAVATAAARRHRRNNMVPGLHARTLRVSAQRASATSLFAKSLTISARATTSTTRTCDSRTRRPGRRAQRQERRVRRALHGRAPRDVRPARQVGHRVPERWEPSLGDYIDIAAYLIGAT